MKDHMEIYGRNDYFGASFQLIDEKRSPKSTIRSRQAYIQERLERLSEKGIIDMGAYLQRREEKLKARELAKERRDAITEMAQVAGIPSIFGRGCGIKANPEYLERTGLAENVYDNGCQANSSGECGPCERFDTNLCQILGEITMREE